LKEKEKEKACNDREIKLMGCIWCRWTMIRIGCWFIGPSWTKTAKVEAKWHPKTKNVVSLCDSTHHSSGW